MTEAQLNRMAFVAARHLPFELQEDGRQEAIVGVLSALPRFDTSWHPQIGDPTVADSILDRLVHNAHRIELKGESMRKRRNAKTAGEKS